MPQNREYIPADMRDEVPERKTPVWRNVLDFVIIIVLAVGITWAVRTFLMQAYEIPSGSMEDTIEIGDRVFSEKLSYHYDDITRGDIITFTDPGNPEQTLIKRVIAVGGQTVELKDGSVYVDGTMLSETYTEGKPSYPLDQQLAGVEVSYPYKVPEGYVWVMGDNRTDSADSRYFGAIPESSVTGRAFIIYWPFNHFKALS